MRKLGVVLVALLAAAVPASAQDKKVEANIGGGYTASLSEVREHLGDGYNVNLGITVNASPVIGIQGEYSFNGLGKKQVDLPVSPSPTATAGATQPFFGDMNMQYGDINLVFRPQTSGRARPYMLVGVGVYYRPIKVTTRSVGYVPGYCDPWWYVCYPGMIVPVDEIVGSRSSTDFGMDFGGGFNFKMSDAASFYVEARYHYIWGPTIASTRDVGSSVSKKANGQFLPITFGLRF